MSQLNIKSDEQLTYSEILDIVKTSPSASVERQNSVSDLYAEAVSYIVEKTSKVNVDIKRKSEE